MAPSGLRLTGVLEFSVAAACAWGYIGVAHRPDEWNMTVTNKLGNIVFYADDSMALSEFWAAVFGYEVRRFEGELRDTLLASSLTEQDLASKGLAEDPVGVGPRMFFHHADGPKGGRNRLHLDVNVQVDGKRTLADLDAERERLEGLGATVVRLVEQTWGPWPEQYYQMRDPEGNEFCLQ